MTEKQASAGTSQEKKPVTDVKGKGKAVEEKPIDVEEEEIDDDDEDEDMDDVEDEDDDDAEQDDDMEEIDLTNIVSRRTRGKKIDYAKEAEAAGNDLEDDDDDDEEYVAPNEERK